MKYVYFFGAGKAEGSGDMKEILGGKGAGLAEMTRIGLPVPSGFTISTACCDYYLKHNHKHPPRLRSEVEKNLSRLERAVGKKFGDARDPLLVSVRSGSARSMPGMLETILNLGLNDKSVEGLGRKTGNPRFAYDSYRRLIQMFGNVVLEITKSAFDEVFDAKKKQKKAKLDTDLDAKALETAFASFR